MRWRVGAGGSGLCRARDCVDVVVRAQAWRSSGATSSSSSCSPPPSPPLRVTAAEGRPELLGFGEKRPRVFIWGARVRERLRPGVLVTPDL
jgi:hypothetical protein